MKLFAVIRTRGAGWRAGVPLEGQQDWGPHARFMNDLAARGVVVLGGPLEGTTDVLLIMRAERPRTMSRESLMAIRGRVWICCE